MTDFGGSGLGRRLILTVPEDLAAFYAKEADERDQPLESVLESRIVNAVDLRPDRRYLVVTGDDLQKLETILHGGHCRTTADLVNKVSRLAVITFGEHEIRLTPGQLEELAWLAQKQGRTVEEMIRLAYERFAADFFQLIPGRS